MGPRLGEEGGKEGDGGRDDDSLGVHVALPEKAAETPVNVSEVIDWHIVNGSRLSFHTPVAVKCPFVH